jgi:hypothetical protein
MNANSWSPEGRRLAFVVINTCREMIAHSFRGSVGSADWFRRESARGM